MDETQEEIKLNQTRYTEEKLTWTIFMKKENYEDLDGGANLT